MGNLDRTYPDRKNMKPGPEVKTRTGKNLRPGPDRSGSYRTRTGGHYPDRKNKTRTRTGPDRNGAGNIGSDPDRITRTENIKPGPGPDRTSTGTGPGPADGTPP